MVHSATESLQNHAVDFFPPPLRSRRSELPQTRLGLPVCRPGNKFSTAYKSLVTIGDSHRRGTRHSQEVHDYQAATEEAFPSANADRALKGDVFAPIPTSN